MPRLKRWSVRLKLLSLQRGNVKGTHCRKGDEPYAGVTEALYCSRTSPCYMRPPPRSFLADCAGTGSLRCCSIYFWLMPYWQCMRVEHLIALSKHCSEGVVSDQALATHIEPL